MVAARQYIIPVNRQSGLYQYAHTNNLGQFLSAEFPVQYQGVEYRAQVFERGIAYNRAGDPGSVKHITYQAQLETMQDQGANSIWSWFKQLIGWK